MNCSTLGLPVREGNGNVSDSFAIPWTVAPQAPLSTEFSRQEYWSVLPFPSPGESSQPRDRTQVSCIAGRFFTIRATREASYVFFQSCLMQKIRYLLLVSILPAGCSCFLRKLKLLENNPLFYCIEHSHQHMRSYVIP